VDAVCPPLEGEPPRRQTVWKSVAIRGCEGLAMLVVIDYQMGNLRSVQKAFEAVGHQALVTRDQSTIANSSHLVLPGVGAFPDCMANLEQYGLIEPIRKSIRQGKPFLGICLGMQLLFTESEEFGQHKGLDLVPGRVKSFPVSPSEKLKVPHMGWNDNDLIQKGEALFAGIHNIETYFVHSYYAEVGDHTIATCNYETLFASAVNSVADWWLLQFVALN